MDKAARKQGANAKREGLRDGRIRAAREASAASEELSGNDADTERTAIQDAGRTLSDFTATGDTPKRGNRRDRNHERSITGQPGRIGQPDRRTEKGDSGAIADSPADEKPARAKHEQHAVTVGRFATDEIIDTPEPFKLDIIPDGAFSKPSPELSRYKEDYRRTTREGANVYAMIDAPELFVSSDTYKSLASRKDIAPEQPKQKLWKSASVLSKQEAEDLREPLEAGLSDGGGYIDKLLWKACPQLDERPVWSNLTDIECRAIAKILLKRGQIDPLSATVVRAIVDGADYATVAMALGPRLMETSKALRERPRVERKKKFSVVRTLEAEHAN